jgi:ribulose-phosphate 3-epimerase
LSEVLEEVDLVCVMSVNPGFGGQKFIEHSYAKVANLKEMLLKRGVNTKIEVDGGVTDKNAQRLIDVGADILVAGSYLFNSADPIASIAALKALT